MSDTSSPSPELAEILSELRQHLAWQEAEGPRTVLVERNRASASSEARAESRPLRPTPTASPRAGDVEARAEASAGRERVPFRPSPSRAGDLEARERAPAQAERSASASPVPVERPVIPVPSADLPRQTLDEIRRELGDCQRCKLCTGRKQIVFGVGNPRAELVFVGEGPGADEDAQGIPFVGKAGQLLTKMIEAMGFSRDEVYICNVVKCRPPGNRNPEPDEIEACEPFLKAQLRSIQPKAIVALGKFAAQTLLRDSTPITRLRGQWRSYEGIRLMPTFHPAYLLRQPGEKKLAWNDLQQVMAVFGKKPARGSGA